MRAKSTPAADPERLTTHSRTVQESVGQIEERIGLTGLLASEPAFWNRVRHAALLHDTGKIAEGFQQQIVPGGRLWRQRHEVLSLAYVDLMAKAASWTEADRLAVATLVVTHHRALHPPGGSSSGAKLSLAEQYTTGTRWDEAFDLTPLPGGGEQRQVLRGRHRELCAWLAGALAVDPPVPGEPQPVQRARLLFEEVLETWRRKVEPDDGLLAVLAQGALTLADHAGSAHERLQTHLPLPADYFARLPHVPYAHQREAAGTEGPLVLVAPTGSGKTEAGLAWAARQLSTMPGLPRLVWTLPYRASLNAARRRFEGILVPAPGDEIPDIGLLHGTAAHTLLQQAVEDECESDTDRSDNAPTVAMARQARARVGAMRLFAQRMRVATPHQLLSAAIAGPTYSSVLLEQANSLFVLDELHAYEPETFGRLCAAMALWERLGSRTAILSATLAPPMTDLIEDSLTEPVTVVRARQGTSPVRHRLVLDDSPLTSPESRDRLRSWLAEGHSVLAVVNTVGTAQKLFDDLADAAREAQPGDPHAAMLLHSHFKNRDRDAIETALLKRHQERRTDDPARRGGLVVATQTVEVSLQLDFDRGAVEAAPIEAVAQRAGRVNRRGLHPDGAVEFRVHRGDRDLPYESAAVNAAWTALNALHSQGIDTLSEQDIDQLLALAYDTGWGRTWAKEARRARDEFAQTFFTFTEPFRDRSDFAKQLSDQLDQADVLHKKDVDEYRELTEKGTGHALLGSGLLIPVRKCRLKAYRGTYDRHLGLHVIEGEYDEHLGLRPPAEQETIL